MTGSDNTAYPPMSDLLRELGIPILEPYAESNLDPAPDLVVIGNALGLPYGVSALAGGALCFGLRFMAIRHGWHLPVAHLSAQGRAEIDRSNEKTTTREEN